MQFRDNPPSEADKPKQQPNKCRLALVPFHETVAGKMFYERHGYKKPEKKDQGS